MTLMAPTSPTKTFEIPPLFSQPKPLLLDNTCQWSTRCQLWFNAYRRLFTISVTLNLIGIVLAITRMWTYPRHYTGAFVLGNIQAAILVRNEIFTRLLYLLVNTLFAKWPPLSFRLACTSTLQHLGGIHSGCALSGIAWLVFRVVLVFEDHLRYHDSVKVFGVLTTAGMSVTFCSALPYVRNRWHNVFEKFHRFAGWITLIFTWIFVLLGDLYDLNTHQWHLSAAHIFRQQDLWFIIGMSIFTATPWLSIRRVKVEVELPSNTKKLVLLHLERGMQQGLLARICPCPMGNYHLFGVISEGTHSGKHMLVCGAQGDFTKRLVENPPKYIWTRQLKLAGPSNTSGIYHRGIRVCTGTGIGSSLATCIQNPSWYLLWICNDHQTTFGPSITDLIHTHIEPSRRTIFDTKLMGGRPDVMALVRAAYAKWGAEVVFVTSNRKGNRDVMEGCVREGIPVFSTNNTYVYKVEQRISYMQPPTGSSHLWQCNSSWNTFSDPCVRNCWSTILPFAWAIILLPGVSSTASYTWKKVAPEILKNAFTPFLQLEEAQLLEQRSKAADGSEAVESRTTYPTGQLWKIYTVSFIGIFQTMMWMGNASYNLASHDIRSPWALDTMLMLFTALTWLYVALYAVLRTKRSAPPVGLAAVSMMLFFSACFVMSGSIYDSLAYGRSFPPYPWLTNDIVECIMSTVLVGVVLSMRFAIPDADAASRLGKTTTPEDYCTLYEWLTFSWIYRIIRKGRKTTLQEDDVWPLSLTFQSSLLYEKFSTAPYPSLIRKMWECNAYDSIVQLILVFFGVFLEYSAPFFLQRILVLLEQERTTEVYSHICVLALVSFLCKVLKTETDLQHLWLSRRIATRVRSELMASIYDKSLRRKDFSGIVNKDVTGSTSADDKTVNEPKAGADTGKIVNLMSTDAQRVSSLFEGLFMFYGSPVALIISAVMLYQLLGISGFLGYFILLVFVPLNKVIFSRAVEINKGVSASRDTRMAVVTELISSIKFIKFFAWEEQWVKRVKEKREVEMQWLIKSRWNSLYFQTLYNIPPILVSVLSFLAYVALGNQLTVSVAFTSLTLFAMIQEPLTIIPMFIVRLIQTKVSVDRIAKFLDEEEVDEQVSTLKQAVVVPSSDQDTPEGFGIQKGTFKWNEVVDEPKADAKTAPEPAQNETPESAVEPESRFELRDIDVMFPDGELTLVTGPTASGKTALLTALLGELTLISGKIIMAKNPKRLLPGGLIQSISYASQVPWLRHQSIKDNILFDSEYDEDRYNEVIACCALAPDFDVLEDGDQTEIGAKGVSLSGGQKARVALARAVYARTKYVLLDDPLSAVDSHTARLLFDKLLCGPLLRNRTVVLVTHHVELVLPGAHYLIRMLDGRIDLQGTVKELRSQGILEHIKQEEQEVVLEQEESEVVPKDGMTEVQTEEPTADAPVVAKKDKARRLVEDEHRDEGGVKWSVYMTYIRASSYAAWAIAILGIILYQSNGLVEKYWLKQWGEAYNTAGNNAQMLAYLSSSSQEPLSDFTRSAFSSHSYAMFLNLQTPAFWASSVFASLPEAGSHPFFFIGIYCAIVTVTSVLKTVSTGAYYLAYTYGGRKLFDDMLHKIVRATMRWYDTTPSGRILNRFGKDIETIDTSVAQFLWLINAEGLGLVVVTALIIGIFPLFSIPVFIIGCIYLDLSSGYLKTGRDLKRMESNTRSPIFSDFTEVLEGIVTVRAFSAERRFLQNMHRKIDLTTKMAYIAWMTNRWLLFRFDILGGLTVLITTLFTLTGYVSAGTAAVCITSAMSFTRGVYWVCRFYTQLELDLNSVERVVEYLNVPEEPPAVIESNRPPAYWPSTTTREALIRVENLNIKYAPELPSVLHNVSFELKAGERIGLLGRTGSGKSTLAMSLLRFVDPSQGRIIIDGIDISKIGVSDVRSRLTFIPQDATLFSGTIRENLDPFNEHDDAECLDALYRAHMISDKDRSAHPSRSTTPRSTTPDPSHTNGDHPPPEDSDTLKAASETASMTSSTQKITLSTMVSASGANFSQGQKQLLAMARALLRRSSIVILDEATSSIDFKTDEKIQTAIREEFGGALLLTIAHRLRTVVDYDRLIVLDKGNVAELDTPANLIKREGGIFREMCLRSGSYEELEAIALSKNEQ